jgi:hypothetical protein
MRQAACHCAKPNDAGHGPNYRLTLKVKGKTVTQTFAFPAALRKAQQEVLAFHSFQQLCHQLIAVSEKSCYLRPLQETLTPQGKKRRKRSSTRSPRK